MRMTTAKFINPKNYQKQSQLIEQQISGRDEFNPINSIAKGRRTESKQKNNNI